MVCNHGISWFAASSLVKSWLLWENVYPFSGFVNSVDKLAQLPQFFFPSSLVCHLLVTRILESYEKKILLFCDFKSVSEAGWGYHIIIE